MSETRDGKVGNDIDVKALRRRIHDITGQSGDPESKENKEAAHRRAVANWGVPHWSSPRVVDY